MAARIRILLATAIAAAALLGACSAPPPNPLTAGEKDDLCRVLREQVVFTAASDVFSAVYLFRSYGPSLPGGGGSLPYPDCAYLARSNFADRLEVFYFGPPEGLADEIVGQLESSGYTPDGSRWIKSDGLGGQPWSFARVEQFYGASDAAIEFRVYAELINRPGIVVSVTSRLPRS